MKNTKFFSIRLILVTLSFAALPALADCDQAIKSLRTQHLGGATLCELQERYKKALASLSRAGISNPRHIGNAYALRFINKPNWNQFLKKNGDSEFAAWRVYQPSPTVWSNWSTLAAIIDSPKTPNIFLNGTAAEISEWLRGLHVIAVSGLLVDFRVGKFRSDVEEIIPLHSVHDAYTKEQIESVSRTPFKSVTGLKLMTWDPRFCDDLPQAQQLNRNHYFKLNPASIREPLKSCGDLTMAPANEVEQQMNDWAMHIQQGMKSPDKVDLVAFISGIQQWMVVIHPFVDGNGRLSRLMMDFILNQYHLPLPTLDDMNRDFFASPEEWAQLVGKGMLNTVQALETCVRMPTALGCKMVSDSSPLN